MYSGDLVFATNNEHKLREVREIFSKGVRVLSLREINCNDELPETHDTLEENAEEKALFIYEKYRVNCFAEDTGLEVQALNGAPGVFSARYAGEKKDARENVALLLRNLGGVKDRRARFKAVIALIIEGNIYKFSGVINGKIAEAVFGKDGFGYDPVFIPEGENLTFAQMSGAKKNEISHRKVAVEQMAEFLKKM